MLLNQNRSNKLLKKTISFFYGTIGGEDMKKKSFFRLLFLSFLMIILVYTIGVTGVYFYKNDQINDQERRNNHKMMLVQVQQAMDKRIQAALNEVIQLQSSDTFKQYSKNNNEALKYYHINQVFKELQSDSTLFANYQFNIGVLKSDEDSVITPNYTINRQKYFNELGLDTKNIKELQEFIEDDNWSSRFKVYPLVTKTKEENLTFVKKSRIQNGKVTLFFLTFLHQDSLRFSENGSIQDGFAVVSKNQVLMKDTNFDDKITKTLLSTEKLKAMKAKHDLGWAHFTLEVSDFTVHGIGSEIIKDWQYIYMVPSKIEHPISISGLIQTVLVLFGLIIVGILVTLLLANYIYRPVKKIVSVLKEGQDIDTPDEFSFIHDKTIKIKSLNEHLQATIEQSKLSLRVKYLRELLLGLAPKDSIHEDIKQLNLNVLEDKFTLILFSYRKNSDLTEQLSQDGINKLKAQAISFLNEVLKSKSSFEMVELESEKVAIIIKESDLSNVELLMSQTINQLQADIRTSIVLAIADPVLTVTSIEHAYKQARNLLDYQFMFDKKAILTMKDIEDLEQESYFYPMDIEVDLIQLILRGKKEKALFMLQNILQENLKERKLNKTALSQFVLAIAGTVNRILHHVNKPVQEIFRNEKDLYSELLNFNDRKELETKIHTIFNMVFKEFAREESENTTMGDKLVNYVQQNYESDISLTDLSEEFDLSSSYISTIFKTHTGENFKEYLNRYRIQKAKEILSSNNVQVNQVAVMVGYNNVNTFIRLFKKYVGLSPGQYEKNS
jgi:two-component system, response regulator YesN